jgi:hypothetical protein
MGFVLPFHDIAWRMSGARKIGQAFEGTNTLAAAGEVTTLFRYNMIKGSTAELAYKFTIYQEYNTLDP